MAYTAFSRAYSLLLIALNRGEPCHHVARWARERAMGRA